MLSKYYIKNTNALTLFIHFKLIFLIEKRFLNQLWVKNTPILKKTYSDDLTKFYDNSQNFFFRKNEENFFLPNYAGKKIRFFPQNIFGMHVFDVFFDTLNLKVNFVYVKYVFHIFDQLEYSGSNKNVTPAIRPAGQRSLRSAGSEPQTGRDGRPYWPLFGRGFFCVTFLLKPLSVKIAFYNSVKNAERRLEKAEKAYIQNMRPSDYGFSYDGISNRNQLKLLVLFRAIYDLSGYFNINDPLLNNGLVKNNPTPRQEQILNQLASLKQQLN
ncbi:hypothetical protein BpHYR1_017960 [Brachionus plicatilis]|uniref:Uncharacterized protein n=1 Tax=Brachionus plicatilis TaxID=10195 RepID=A0A3M7R7V5_BRAPC|nr:hypothetical protein BpHYR1_017960 [Brachionus plicatilis]